MQDPGDGSNRPGAWPNLDERLNVGERTCAVGGCERDTVARGWCSRHWQRWRKTGDPLGSVPRAGSAIDHDDGTRTCGKCGTRQPLAVYDVDRKSALGRKAQCRECRALGQKLYYETNRAERCERQRRRLVDNPERVRQQDAERYERDKPKRIALAKQISHRARAAEAGVEFDPTVTVDGLLARDGDECCYCAVTMTFDLMLAHSYDPARATLEHVIPMSRGGSHTWGNTALACWRCNISKSDQTVEEWRSDSPRGTYRDGKSNTTAPVDANR